MFKNILSKIKKEVTKAVSDSNKANTKKVVVNESVGLVGVNYINDTEVMITTKSGDTFKYVHNTKDSDPQSAVEKLVKNKENISLEKKNLQDKIDKYNSEYPNNGCTFVILHMPESQYTNWNGYYIRVSEIKPINNTITIPYICDVFNPKYSNVSANSTLIVKTQDNTFLKETDKMFDNIKVKNLDLKQFDVSVLEKLNGLFHSPQKTFDTVDVTGWDITKAPNNSLSNVFRYANITNLIGLETWNTSNITNFTQVFFEAKIENLNISNWNISKMITGMPQKGSYPIGATIFQGAKLGKIDLSNWDVSKVEYFWGWFAGCNIQSVGNISNWNVSSGVLFDNLFANATIEDKVDISKWNIKQKASTIDMLKNSSNSVIR